MSKTGIKFEELVEIMAKLRSPDGCPWDRKQTYKDIAAHTLEETYEVLDAIDKNDFDGLCEELGDLMLQVVFYSQIANEEKKFTIDDVMERIKRKLIHRHPHVFGDAKVSGSQEVLERWEQLKKEEGKDSVVGGVPNALPALLKAFRLGEKTSRMGFDWDNADGILAKVEEEAHELHEAKASGNKDDIDHEYGDLLFTMANLGRFLGLDPEGSLRRANKKFIERFKHMENSIKNEGSEMNSLSPDRWEDLWNEAKKADKG
ncbi:MAG: nucleoside triphosphate pyrophosphohydrolase [Deltaproteobacteria bacterium]|jgi:tetrapyrrole methylase family protein / MazG family protein|nr:nucleoside triphosphate pyrophosphohydrolase [Deltaproteobacteria bacterium]